MSAHRLLLRLEAGAAGRGYGLRVGSEPLLAGQRAANCAPHSSHRQIQPQRRHAKSRRLHLRQGSRRSSWSERQGQAVPTFAAVAPPNSCPTFTTKSAETRIDVVPVCRHQPRDKQGQGETSRLRAVLLPLLTPKGGRLSWWQGEARPEVRFRRAGSGGDPGGQPHLSRYWMRRPAHSAR